MAGLGGVIGSFMGGGGAMGGVIGQVIVRLGLDNSPLLAGLAQSKTATTSTAAQMEGAAATSSKAMTSLWVGAALAAGAALGAFALKGMQYASDLNESMNKVRNVFGSAADSVIDFANESAVSLGQTRGEALDAAGSFGAMLTAMGTAEDKAASMSVTLVQLASDLGSFYNIDPASMLERLRSGLAGEMEALRRFGIVLSATRVEAKAVEMGLADMGDELTDEQKLTARFALIMQDSQAAANDFSETLGSSLPNQMRVARAQVVELSMALGEGLLPIALDVLKAANGLMVILKPVAQNADTLFKVLVAYMALKFLPSLMFTTAMGLERIGLTSVAAAVGTGRFNVALASMGTLARTGLAAAILAAFTILPQVLSAATTSARELASELKVPLQLIEDIEDVMGNVGPVSTYPGWGEYLGDIASLDIKTTEEAIKEIIPVYQEWEARMRAAGVEQYAIHQVLKRGLLVWGQSGNSVEAFIEEMDYWANGSMAQAEEQIEDTTDALRQLVVKNRGPLQDFLKYTGQDFDEWSAKLMETFKAEEPRKAFLAFLKEQEKAYQQFASGVEQQMNFVANSFSELASQENVTLNKLIGGMQKTLKAQREMGNDLVTIQKRAKQLGVNLDALTMSLVGMGEDGVKAADLVANANDEKFKKIAGIWQKAEGDAKSTGNAIADAIIGPLESIEALLRRIAHTWIPTIKLQGDIEAAERLNYLADQLAQIEGTHHVSINVSTTGDSTLGGIPIAQGGVIAGASGFVTRGPTYLVGEGLGATRFGRGAEAVLPLSASMLSRLGKAIVDASPRQGGGGATVVIQGDIYGMPDFERKVERALAKALTRNR